MPTTQEEPSAAAQLGRTVRLVWPARRAICAPIKAPGGSARDMRLAAKNPAGRMGRRVLRVLPVVNAATVPTMLVGPNAVVDHGPTERRVSPEPRANCAAIGTLGGLERQLQHVGGSRVGRKTLCAVREPRATLAVEEPIVPGTGLAFASANRRRRSCEEQLRHHVPVVH